MRKLSLKLDSLQVQSFPIASEAVEAGTVLGHAKGTGLQDTNCSAIDRCPSARGCTLLPTCLPAESRACDSAIDQCPSVWNCPTEIC